MKKQLSGLLIAFCAAPALASSVVLTAPNGIEITKKDIESYLVDRVPEERRFDYLSSPKAVKDLVESLLVIKSIANEAQNTDSFDADQYERRASFYKDRLATQDFLKELVRDRLKDVDWDAMAKDVYTAEGFNFVDPETVVASHILITANERSEEEAEALAQQVKAELESGKSFKALAIKYSEDPSVKKNFGNLGSVPRGKMVKPFEDAVFAMREPGSLSGPVKTRFGYHIIQLDSYSPEVKRTFDEVKAQIVTNLKTELAKKIQADKVTEIKSNPKITVNTDLMEQIHQEQMKLVEESK